VAGKKKMRKQHPPKRLTINDFDKAFQQLTYMHNASDIFDHFLEYIILGWCADGSEVWQHKDRYTQDETKKFFELFQVYVQVMDGEVFDGSWYDLFGTYYEMFIVNSFKQKNRAQFFTPPHMCDMMAILNGCQAAKSKNALIGDPACGSGRCLLAFFAGGGQGNYYAAEDLDRTCCLMTVVNFLMHGVDGEVIWHNSLDPDTYYYGWRVNRNLNNPFHRHFGIPHVQKLEKENSAVWQSWQAKKVEHLANVEKEKAETEIRLAAEERMKKKGTYSLLSFFD